MFWRIAIGTSWAVCMTDLCCDTIVLLHLIDMLYCWCCSSVHLLTLEHERDASEEHYQGIRMNDQHKHAADSSPDQGPAAFGFPTRRQELLTTWAKSQQLTSHDIPNKGLQLQLAQCLQCIWYMCILKCDWIWFCGDNTCGQTDLDPQMRFV